MASIGNTIGSRRMALAEALAFNHHTGMKIPELVRASKVPRNTAHRVLKDFKKKGLVKVVTKEGKAEIYKLDMEKPEVVGLIKSTTVFTQHVARAKAERPRTVTVQAPVDAPHEEACFREIPVNYTGRGGTGTLHVSKRLTTNVDAV